MHPPVILIGEAFGANEAVTQTSFVGSSGIELLRMLDEAGIISLTSSDIDFIRGFYNFGDPSQIDMIWRLHPEVHRTNVFNFHPPGNDIESICGPKETKLPGYPMLVKGKFVRAEFASELERLAHEILALDPHLIITLGNTPLWALCGQTGVSKIRGTTRISTYTITDYKVLPTYHPAAVLRQWELRPVAVADLMKAKREAEFPEIRRPDREIWIEPTLEDIHEFRRLYIEGCRILSTDIETSGNQVTCIGFAPTIDRAIVIPLFDERKKGRNYWSNVEVEQLVWRVIRDILEDKSIKKLFQNGLYDIAFLYRSMKIKVYGATEDTMLLSHALQPEMLKGLAFLGSLYTDEGSWKSDRRGITTIKKDE